MGTTLIKAKVTDQTLEFTLKPMVASGGVNEDVIEFEFDELWDGFDMVAVFYRSKREVFHQKNCQQQLHRPVGGPESTGCVLRRRDGG